MRISSLLTICLSFVALSGCDSSNVDATPPPTPVRVATAVEGPAAPAIRTNGVMSNKDEFRLSFKVGGVIKRIAVREGERVRPFVVGKLSVIVRPADPLDVAGDSQRRGRPLRLGLIARRDGRHFRVPSALHRRYDLDGRDLRHPEHAPSDFAQVRVTPQDSQAEKQRQAPVKGNPTAADL